MGQYPPQYQPQYAPRPPSNNLGVAGFVISLVGFLVCAGVPCPVGMVLSLAALGKEPRGLAIAGVIIGAVGSLGWIIFMLFGGLAILGGLLTAAGGAGP